MSRRPHQRHKRARNGRTAVRPKIHIMKDSSLTDWRQLHGSHFAGQRVLVTGGAGFIGSHLAEVLCRLGSEVVVLDDLSAGHTDNLLPARALGRVDFVQASLLDEAALARCTRGCRYVFHEAALGSVPRSVEQPRLYHDVNTTGTLNVLEAARAAGVRRVMFAASSSALWGNRGPAQDRVDPAAAAQPVRGQ